MTERYLLFDSGCSVCTRLAEDIEQASDGWLMARSLRDPDVKTLLDAARPGWRWEPTLLEVTDGRPRVFTGIAMRARMALGLGPRRAWRVVRLVYRTGSGLAREGRRRFLQNDFATSRRSFLKGIMAVAGLAILPQSKGSAVASQQGYDKNPFNTRHLSGPEAEEFISLARNSVSLQGFQQKLEKLYQGRFELRVDKVNVLEVTGHDLVIVRFAISGGVPSSVFAIIYNKQSRQEVDTIHALFYPLDRQQFQVDASAGETSITAVLGMDGRIIKGIYQDGSSSYPIQGLVTAQYDFFDCLGCCLSSAGISQFVITTITLLCTAACLGSGGALCVPCIVAAGAISNGLASYCAGQCLNGINCCTTRCAY
jgi:hypothetical protein